ncbi:uncharacterized protein LOC144360724 [Saccoglossus kowalevskii]
MKQINVKLAHLLMISRLGKNTTDGTKAYSINTQTLWDNERPLLSSFEGSLLQVNILQKQTVFLRESPIIKIVQKRGAIEKEIEPPPPARKHAGRKRSLNKIEDEKLVNKLKKGEDVDITHGNMRYNTWKYETEANFGNSERRNGKHFLLIKNRTPQARISYFKDKYYVKSCGKLRQQEEKGIKVIICSVK